MVLNTCLRQFFSVQECLPGTFVQTKNKVSKFCKENSNAFRVSFNLNEYYTYSYHYTDC